MAHSIFFHSVTKHTKPSGKGPDTPPVLPAFLRPHIRPKRCHGFVQTPGGQNPAPTLARQRSGTRDRGRWRSLRPADQRSRLCAAQFASLGQCDTHATKMDLRRVFLTLPAICPARTCPQLPRSLSCNQRTGISSGNNVFNPAGSFILAEISRGSGGWPPVSGRSPTRHAPGEAR